MSVGSQLRQARAARTLSIADVTKSTKIQPWVIEALEADRLQEIMSPVYVKGLLTAYAKFLRLEPEPLVSQLPQPHVPAEPEPQRSAVASIPVTIEMPWWLLRQLAVVAAAGALVVAVIRVHPLQRLPKIAFHARSQAKVTKAAPSKTKPSQPKVAKIESPAPVQPKLASVSPIAETTNTSPPPITLQPVQPLELSVTANRTTWILVRADGKLLTQQLLQRGLSKRWTAKKEFQIIIAKPSQVDLTLNGQSISPFAIAHRGRLVITHRGIAQLPDQE